MQRKNTATLFLIGLVIVSLLTGCSGSATSQNTNSNGETTEKAATSTTAGVTSLPETATITWWQTLDSKAVSMIDWDESPTWQYIQKKLNIDIKWKMPASAESKEQFSLMISARALTDVVYNTWINVAGGPAQLIADGQLMDLTGLLVSKAPNYYSFITDPNNETIRRQVTLNDGTHYIFAKVFPDSRAMSYGGLMIRQDWLDKLKLAKPTTVDEWYTVLLHFRDDDPNGNGKKDELPFLAVKTDKFDSFAAAFKVRSGLYPDPDTGKIVCGYLQDDYKLFLKKIAQWYKDGLIDPEYVATDATNLQNKMTTNLGGSFYGALAGGMGTILSLMSSVQPEYNLTGLTNPKSIEDSIIYTSNDPLCRAFVGQGAAINAGTRQADAAFKILDFCYSKEGIELLNWGIKDESYEVNADGFKRFTSEILKNSKGLSPAQSVIRYAYPSSDAPTICDYDARKQINNALQQQADAAEIWADCDRSMLLPVLFPTGSDSSRISKILSEVDTYANENITSFIIGRKDIEANWGTFIKTIESMGISEAIAIQQKTYDGYLNKP